MTKTTTVTFYECEHDGDLEYVHSDITRSGGTVINSVLDGGVASVTFSYNENTPFLDKFRETDSYEMSNVVPW